MDVNIKINCNIAEIQSKTSIFDDESIEYLQTRLEEVIKNEVKSRRPRTGNETDFFGAADASRINIPQMGGYL